MGLIASDQNRDDLAMNFASIEALLADPQAKARDPNPRTIYWDQGDDDEAARLIEKHLGRTVSFPSLHLRLWTSDLHRFGCVVLHNWGSTGEAELMAWTLPGIWHRSTIRFVANWAFNTCGFRRIVLKIPADQTEQRDYARRLGFRHESMARQFFTDDRDASVWAMTRSDCRWLRRA